MRPPVLLLHGRQLANGTGQSWRAHLYRGAGHNPSSFNGRSSTQQACSPQLLCQGLTQEEPAALGGDGVEEGVGQARVPGVRVRVGRYRCRRGGASGWHVACVIGATRVEWRHRYTGTEGPQQPTPEASWTLSTAPVMHWLSTLWHRGACLGTTVPLSYATRLCSLVTPLSWSAALTGTA